MAKVLVFPTAKQQARTYFQRIITSALEGNPIETRQTKFDYAMEVIEKYFLSVEDMKISLNTLEPFSAGQIEAIKLFGQTIADSRNEMVRSMVLEIITLKFQLIDADRG